MIVKETTNIDDIKAILCHPDIYDTISGDSSPSIDDFEPPMDDDHEYVGGFVNGEIIALMVYYSDRDGRICHVHVLPEFRKDYAKKFGEQALLFRGTQKLYAEIPTLYKNVLDFAVLNGFEIIGTIKDNHVKNKVKYDTKILKLKS